MEKVMTVLSVDSVRVNPNPAVIGKEVHVEVTISQEHYSVSLDDGIEFPLSNESLTKKLIEVGKMAKVSIDDVKMDVVQCICKDMAVDLVYSEETGSWSGSFTAPSTTAWYEEDHAYGLTIFARDVEGNKVIVDRDDPILGDNLKLRVYEVSTLLKVESVSIDPSPVTINQPFSVEAVIKQEHYYILPAAELEFPLANESIERRVIEAGKFVYVEAIDAPDNKINFVKCLFNDEYMEFEYSEETDSWKGSFVAPAITSWSEENHAFGLILWTEDDKGHSIIVDRNTEGIGEQLLVPVYDTATVLNVDSISITPNPVNVDEEYTVEVVISQKHNYVLYGSSLEFPFSNESLTEDLVEIGEFLLGPVADVPDNEMAIVRYELQNSFGELFYSSEKNAWIGVFTAPSKTSWDEDDHVYMASIYAEDVRGNRVYIDYTNKDLGDDLRLRVLDTTPPDLVLLSPWHFSYVTSSNPRFTFKVLDLSPGVDIDSIQVILDGKSIPYKFELLIDEDGNELFSCVSKDRVRNGQHTYSILIRDYDGNETHSETIEFMVDNTAGHGETFVIGEAMFEWFRKQVLVSSGVMELEKFDMNLVFDWMKSYPETGIHLFQIAVHHDDDDILYKLQVDVKR